MHWQDLEQTLLEVLVALFFETSFIASFGTDSFDIKSKHKFSKMRSEALGIELLGRSLFLRQQCLAKQWNIFAALSD